LLQIEIANCPVVIESILVGIPKPYPYNVAVGMSIEALLLGVVGVVGITFETKRRV